MTYTRLTFEDRHYIETRHKLKESTTDIALALGRSQSTIRCELTRNRGGNTATDTRKRTAKRSNARRTSRKQSS